MSGLACLPSRTAMSTRRPTPSRSIVSNGDTPKMPSSMYRLKNAPSTSSREKPQVICVRSFVPKEKNSALAAIGPALRAARGTSIIVPIIVCTPVPVDRKSTRLNSSHSSISYAVFCLKKKKKQLSRITSLHIKHIDNNLISSYSHLSNYDQDILLYAFYFLSLLVCVFLYVAHIYLLHL